MIDQISFKYSSNVYLTPPSATPTPSRAVVSVETIAALVKNDTSSNAIICRGIKRHRKIRNLKTTKPLKPIDNISIVHPDSKP